MSTAMSVAFRVATRREDRERVLARMAAAQADADAHLAAEVDIFAGTIEQVAAEYAERVRTRARTTGHSPFTTEADQTDASAVLWAAHRRVVAAAATAAAIATCHKRVVR